MVTRRTFLQMAGVFACAPVTTLAQTNNGVHVLMYHDINYDNTDPYSVAPKRFRYQMQWLKDNGYKAIPLHRIDEAGPKDIIITFDDGYYSFIEHAQEILFRYNFHSTINVVGEWMSSAVKYIPDTKPRRALHWGHLRELYQSGLVNIGCHTDGLHSLHHGVRDVNQKELWYDFSTFQSNMITHIGKPSNIIAWPFGRYNDLAITEAEQQGFKYFLTSHSGRYSGNKYRIPRNSVEQQTNLIDTL